MDRTRSVLASAASRRRFLAVASAFAMSGVTRRGLGRSEETKTPDVEVVRERAEAVGIGPIRSVTGPTYAVVGDASEPFLKQALRICEALTDDYLEHFARRGFQVERPEGRLTVVALSGPDAFARYLGTTEDEAVGGQYDLETNRLVMFDNRRRANAGTLVERANTVALMHEAMHQLTFNTGLLRRGSPIPLAINEGLGTYAETRRPDGRTPIGRPNEPRLQVLIQARETRKPWIRSAELLFEERAFTDSDLIQQAYAQSWLLVFILLQVRKRAAQFRRFLDALAEPDVGRTPDVPALAEESFEGLDALDRDLMAAFRDIARR